MFCDDSTHACFSWSSSIKSKTLLNSLSDLLRFFLSIKTLLFLFSQYLGDMYKSILGSDNFGNVLNLL